MVSYISQPYKSTVEPYKENVGLIAQVAQQKQSKYDNILSTIFQKQNQLLDLDTSQGSEEAELKKDNLLKEADNQLNKFATSDLTIPDNISKVENIFTPIINDKDIMGAASITAFTKEQAAYFDEWKKEGKGLYDAKNEAYFLEQVQKNRKMTLQEVKEKGYKQPTSVEFVDIDKWYRDSVKELLPDVTSVISPDGFGRIFYQNGKKLSENDILQMLPTNTKIIAQAEINAHYALQDAKPTELLSIQQKSLLQEQASVKALVDDSEKQIGYINDHIKDIQNNTADGIKMVEESGLKKEQLIAELKDKVKQYGDIKTQYEKNYKEYDSKINDFNKNYQFENGIFNKQLTEDELKNLKTSTWLNTKKQQFANAVAYEEKSIKIEYDQVQMEAIKHQYGLEDKYMDYVTKNGTYTLDTDGDGILDAGYNEILNAFGTTSSEGTQEVLKLETGKEYKQLAQIFGEYVDLEKSLPKKAINSISIYEPKYSEAQLQKDEEEVLKILKLRKDPNTKGTDKIPGSEQNYNDFFNDKKNKEILKYIIEKDDIKNQRLANQAILASIQKDAHEKAKSLLGNQKLNVPIKVTKVFTESLPIPDPNNIRLDYKIVSKHVTIPASLTDKYLKGNLNKTDIEDIAGFNKKHFGITEEDTKSIIKDGTPENINYAKYKKEFEQQKNEFAKQYAKGYILPGLYIKDPETAKSVGKYIETNIRQFIRSDLDLDKKYGKKDIEIRKIYRDKDSPSGWSASFNAFGTTVIQGQTVKMDSKSDHVSLTPDLVKELQLNKISNISEIEKHLNQQLLGNKTKNPEFSYNYLGNNYKFVMDKNTKIVTLLENKGNGSFNFLQQGNVNDLIEFVQTKIALQLNK